MASLLPLMVTALSVELGSISLATWMEAPVTSRISLILDPPLPMSEPHWEAGTINRKVIGGRGTVFGDTKLAKSWKSGGEQIYLIIIAQLYILFVSCILLPPFLLFTFLSFFLSLSLWTVEEVPSMLSLFSSFFFLQISRANMFRLRA